MNTRKMARLALLTSIALILFTVELQLPNPFPIPGVKLGLANIITVYAVYHYRPGEVLLLAAARITLASIFGGNLMTLCYSFAGSALCLAGTLYLHRQIPESRLWVCSVLGAVLHNAGQIITAILITRTPALISYFPFLLVSGCAAGLFTGLCAQYVTLQMRNLRGIQQTG